MTSTEVDPPQAWRALGDLLAGVLAQGRRIAVLTGAGVSTDSGIPDYRGPNAPQRTPITYQEFVSDEPLRRRYWARNQLGWQQLRRAQPNAGHRALAAMEQRGLLTGIITQNVDRLHEEAGAERVIDLHGRFDRVICLGCGTGFDRAVVAQWMSEVNPGFLAEVRRRGSIGSAPDADADLVDPELIESFSIAPCRRCGGMLKPDVVFFGENVPRARVEQCYALVAEAGALLVVGSSLTVMSGLRFLRKAHQKGQPIAIVNRGETRGDDLAKVVVAAGASEVLEFLRSRLPDGW